MTRYAPLLVLALAMTGCSLENASETATSVRTGLTQVGEKVQSISASPELKNATESAKSALTTTGEVAIAGTESAKEALTVVGETTVKVGDVAGATLTTIGNTVIEAKTSLSVPEQPVAAGTTPAAVTAPAPPAGPSS